MVSMTSVQSFIKWANPEGGQGVWTPPGKSQVAIGFLGTTGTDSPQEAIGPHGSNCFSKEVRTALCEII